MIYETYPTFAFSLFIQHATQKQGTGYTKGTHQGEVLTWRQKTSEKHAPSEDHLPVSKAESDMQHSGSSSHNQPQLRDYTGRGEDRQPVMVGNSHPPMVGNSRALRNLRATGRHTAPSGRGGNEMRSVNHKYSDHVAVWPPMHQESS